MARKTKETTKAPETTKAQDPTIPSGVSKDFGPQDTAEDVKTRIETKAAADLGGILPGPIPGRWNCPICNTSMLTKNNRRHLEKQHKQLTKAEIDQVIETGLPPTEPEPVFPNALGAILTEFAVMGLTISKRRYFEDEKVVFILQVEHIEQLNELHQALAEKYLGPMVGEYSIEVACLTIWGSALYANFAGAFAPPKHLGD